MDSQAEIYLEKQHLRTHLSFCMEMIREDEAKTVCEEDVVSDGCCCVTGAECAPLKDVVVASPSNTTFRICNFSHEKMKDNLAIRNLKHDKYIRRSGNEASMDPSSVIKSASITIFYYKTTLIEEPFRGIPVVLNFTNTDSFLRCQKSGDRVSVSVEVQRHHLRGKFEKQRLQRFSSRDEDAFSFVFYMMAARDSARRFESAVHGGWFMKAVDEIVGMGPLSPESESSYFIFHEQ
ncbi:uncharacterized protein LOC125722912 isoform X2 [Brienomyrus brachyistius]|uniref:uncharacterized protein LOC125722912 isoform X2 n=1 Tax=Brienomyrus brachyistius TaxID=42636 RepID=UPI0020B3C5CF|nr:uncharacterized protein LOC125722912 isoform X2 [Brienomyrus brachyistius]